MSWLLEEIKEYLDAETLEDVADALGDIIYIALGTAIEHGVDIQSVYDQIDAKRKQLKNPATPGMIEEKYKHERYAVLATVANDLIVMNTAAQVQMLLGQIVHLCVSTAQRYGIDIQPIFYIIHEANMAKLGPDNKPIYKADNKIGKPEGWQPPEPKIIKEIERQIAVAQGQ